MLKEGIDVPLWEATALSPIRLDNELYDFDRAAEDVAEERGCVVVFPEPNQLQIDIDSEEAYDSFNIRFRELMSVLNAYATVKEEVSSSGLPHRHITITLVKGNGDPYVLSEDRRILLQFLLYSDPIRETLNTFRMLVGFDNPTRLFRPKVTK